MKTLREETALLREFMNASSFPGPAPGSMRSSPIAYSMASKLALYPELYGDKIWGKDFKDKNKKKRDTLRKLTLWLQNQKL